MFHSKFLTLWIVSIIWHVQMFQVFTKHNDKLQRCMDGGEAYGASYLITKEHLINHHTAYNLTWVNCEMASFIMYGRGNNPHTHVNGSVMQSVDILDFSVIHLSWFERLQKRHKIRTPKDGDALAELLLPLEYFKQTALRSRSRKYSNHVLTNPMQRYLNRTVVIMPFLGSENGAGHSKLRNRLLYLRACFWSFYSSYPHVVAAVKNIKDQQFARHGSGLPFYDVILLSDLPKSASLPVASVQQTKARLMDGRWDFDYIFFTESDQVLMMRIPDTLYLALVAQPRLVMVPHRLIPYPNKVLNELNRTLTLGHSINTLHAVNEATSAGISHNESTYLEWMGHSCCAPRQFCQERKSWISIKNESVPILNVYGIQVALGNNNFHLESFRACKLLTVKDAKAHVCP